MLDFSRLNRDSKFDIGNCLKDIKVCAFNNTPSALKLYAKIYWMAGYSDKSLVAKLGIKGSQKVALLNAPEGYTKILGQLPEGIEISIDLSENLDFIQYFAYNQTDLKRIFPDLKKNLSYSGLLWISWQKKTNQIDSDLDENKIRQIGLEHGLVDVKVAAIDEDWSGLKFVYRLKDRK